jgi:chromate transport protein ChrA
LAGLIIVITSGFIIWTSDPLRYYYNWAFRYKIIALALAVIYNYTIHRKVAQSAKSATVATGLVATFSLAIWISIVFAGLFYAFT